jgi:hypothetical protein
VLADTLSNRPGAAVLGNCGEDEQHRRANDRHPAHDRSASSPGTPLDL